MNKKPNKEIVGTAEIWLGYLGTWMKQKKALYNHHHEMGMTLLGLVLNIILALLMFMLFNKRCD